MVLTGRVAALAAIGAVVVAAAAPSWAGIAGVTGAVLALVLVDVVLAGSTRALRLSRDGDRTARLGTTATVRLSIRNDGRRRVRGLLRDAWPPSAGVVADRVAVD
ncbi:DUF58 domain-containing protein, partial [Jiangella rhizosphaerae]